MKLIVGLGNPGKKYERTRHNAGFLAVEAFTALKNLSWKQETKLKSELTKYSTALFFGETAIVAKPQTFMNLSGEAVQALVSYYKVAPQDILIVQDELDLAPGTLAFMAKGGPAGNNGIISIQQSLNRKDIARLRIGVGRPPSPIATEDWVLGKLEQPTLETIKRAPEAISDWLTGGIEKAMNKWNRK